MRLSDLHFDLPEALIAQTPLEDRAASRLLVVNRETKEIRHQQFRDVVDLLHPGDVLVMNNTRVTALRLFGQRPTGGQVELFLLVDEGQGQFVALARPGKRLKPGATVDFDAGLQAEILADLGEGRKRVRLTSAGPLQEALAQVGRVPLPPYIHEELHAPERYQTVYAKRAGSSAAPTAGLHFTPEILEALQAKGVVTAEVTLDVGIDTFRPVAVEDLSQHVMHGERCEISPETANLINQRTGRLIAVGTTSCRTLESLADGPGRVRAGETVTQIFITPDNPPQVVDGMFTNFHMPGTTMLAMVASFIGLNGFRSSYRDAVSHQYRFLSFGDSMFIEPARRGV